MLESQHNVSSSSKVSPPAHALCVPLFSKRHKQVTPSATVPIPLDEDLHQGTPAPSANQQTCRVCVRVWLAVF